MSGVRADLTADNVQRLVDDIPDHLRERAISCEVDARTLAAFGLGLIRRYGEFLSDLDLVLPTEGLEDGGDLVMLVHDAIGLETVQDVLLGLAEESEGVIGGTGGEENLRRCREHARNYVARAVDPVVVSPANLSSSSRLPVVDDGACLCCGDDIEHLRRAASHPPAVHVAAAEGHERFVDKQGVTADTTHAVDRGREVVDCPSSTCSHLSRAHHDWLLTCEQRGISGVVEVMQYLETEEALEREEGTLSWVDFPDFVATHNWRDPAGVHGLASMTDALIRSRRNHRKAAY
jgi:hypothetical protein